MSEQLPKRKIWFVYDGECPLCKTAALALRIRKEYGELHLLDARDAYDHKLIQEINARGFDLDEGMVIYDGESFFHGKEALRFMARYGDNKGVFNLTNKALYWSDSVAKVIYPWMRGTRNWLIRRRSVGRIDNLNLESEPIFKSVFGDMWDNLPKVMHKHYANRPYSDDVVIVDGTLDVMCAGPIKFLAPIMKLLGQIPAHNEKDVSVSVEFKSDKDTKSFHFKRTFNFKNAKPYIFHSRMMQIKDNEVIEIMRFGLGWKMLYLWDGEKVVLQHRGYALYLFGHFIPVPLTLLMGKGYAEEIAVDENTFDMITHITHPWWGKVYEYKGRFEVKDEHS